MIVFPFKTRLSCSLPNGLSREGTENPLNLVFRKPTLIILKRQNYPLLRIFQLEIFQTTDPTMSQLWKQRQKDVKRRCSFRLSWVGCRKHFYILFKPTRRILAPIFIRLVKSRKTHILLSRISSLKTLNTALMFTASKWLK